MKKTGLMVFGALAALSMAGIGFLIVRWSGAADTSAKLEFLSRLALSQGLALKQTSPSGDQVIVGFARRLDDAAMTMPTVSCQDLQMTALSGFVYKVRGEEPLMIHVIAADAIRSIEGGTRLLVGENEIGLKVLDEIDGVIFLAPLSDNLLDRAAQRSRSGENDDSLLSARHMGSVARQMPGGSNPVSITARGVSIVSVHLLLSRRSNNCVVNYMKLPGGSPEMTITTGPVAHKLSKRDL